MHTSIQYYLLFYHHLLYIAEGICLSYMHTLLPSRQQRRRSSARNITHGDRIWKIKKEHSFEILIANHRTRDLVISPDQSHENCALKHSMAY